MKFHIEIEAHANPGDSDIIFLFENAIRDRFDGTALHIDSVKFTQVVVVSSKDKKKDIISGDNRSEENCLVHYSVAGRIVYLVNGACPLDDEHNDLNPAASE